MESERGESVLEDQVVCFFYVLCLGRDKEDGSADSHLR